MAVNVSVALNKGVRCVTFMQGGYITEKSYGKYEINGTYNDIIEVMTQTLLQVKKFINKANCTDNEFIIECSNSIFVGWCDKLYSKEQYQDKFSVFLNLLNELPIRYRFVYKEKPLAFKYIKDFKEDMLKPKLSGLNLEVED